MIGLKKRSYSFEEEFPVIPNQWYVLLESDEIESKPVGATCMSEKMVFWRDRQGPISEYLRKREALKQAVEEKVTR